MNSYDIIPYEEEGSVSMNYVVVARQDNYSLSIKEDIIKRLTDEEWVYNEEHPELIICVGGDGTILYALHEYIDKTDDAMFVGIHTGTLGFLTDYTDKELDAFYGDILTKIPNEFVSKLLEIKLDNREDTIYALNELRIENIEKTQSTTVYIDEELFEHCKGSGVVLSTQAGSTAINRGLGGAVIDDGLGVLQLAETTPIINKDQRSLGNSYIMREDRTVAFTSNTFDTAYLCYDHKNIPLKDTKQVECKLSKKKIRFARYRKYSYFDRLRTLY